MTGTPLPPRKKLIEVALPLDAINKAAAREKSLRHGHPSTLHLWWARRPLAACRAVLFASLVDDPSSDPTLTEEEAGRKRDELFTLIEELVQWENSNDPDVLGRARAAILESTGGNPPPVLDPFCGGGSIPLEAQRLGLEAHASDLNPVAVLITKALIEIPPKFAGMKPVHPDARRVLNDWNGAQGLAADVRAYGRWMRDEAERRIGHLYPKARLPRELGGGEATVIAWLWARTVTCPNPACGAEMPLVASLALATKPGKTAWLDPEVDHLRKRVTFRVSAAEPSEGKSIKIGRGVSFRCLVCGQVAEDEYIRLFGRSRGFGQRLLAIVAEGKGRRQYLPASSSQANLTEAVRDLPSTEALLSTHPQYMAPPRFGLVRHSDIFSPRQLLALNTFGELLDDVRSAVRTDASGVMADDGVGLSAGGTGATAYSEAVAVFLAFAIDKAANYWSSVCTWHKTAEKLVSTFGLPVLSMAWDWCEANPFSDSSGNWMLGVEQAAKVAETLPTGRPGTAIHADATKLAGDSVFLVSTDPPYYDSQVLECL